VLCLCEHLVALELYLAFDVNIIKLEKGASSGLKRLIDV
jgi:hypothetical protein